MKLVRWNPIRDMDALWRAFDDEFFAPARPEEQRWGLALDVTENEDNYIVKASIPGVNPEDVDIMLEDSTLSIEGEVKADDTVRAEDYRIRERRYGKFSRSIRFPNDVDSDKVMADYDQGILTLTVPKVEAAKPKKIAISINGK